MTRRRVATLVAALLVLGVGAAVGVATLRDPGPPCGEEWGSAVQGAPDPVLRSIEDVRSSDPLYADHAEMIADAQRFGAPFGALISASPGEGESLNISRLMPVGDDVVLALGKSTFDHDGDLTMVDLSSGNLEWTRPYEAQALWEGVAGDSFVTLVRPWGDETVLRAPVIAAFDPVDGSMIACATVGDDVQTTDANEDAKTRVIRPIGDDLLVVLPRETEERDEAIHGTALSMSRVAPTTGETRWTVALDQDVVDNAGDLDIIDDVALLSTVDASDPTVFVDLLPSSPRSPDADPKVVAYSTDDGHHLWDFPEGTSGTDLSYVHVVGADPETGIIVIESGEWVESSGYPYVLDRTLTGLDTSGTVLWSTTVADTGNPQPDFAAVLGSTVMVHPYAEEDPRLYAWGIADGREVWNESVGLVLRWPEAVQVDGLWLVPSVAGIHVINPATGVAGQYQLPGAKVAVTDEHIVVSTPDRLLVFERPAPS